MKKFLLLVLTAFSVMFMSTGVVNAETQPLKPLDNNVLDVLDSTIHIDKKESEIDISPFDNKDLGSIRNTFINKIKEAGYDTSSFENQGFNVYFDQESDSCVYDIHKIVVSTIINQQSIQKEIAVTYSNTSSYSQAEEQDVKSKVSNIKFQKFYGEDAVYNTYDINDKNIDKWDYDTFNYNTLLNDNSITVKAAVGEGGSSWSALRLRPVDLYFYKNDVLYATKSITAVGMYGFILDNKTPVAMEIQKEDTEIYKEMAKEFLNKKISNILGCFELTAYGEFHDNMKVSFTVGTDYNGRGVKVLHKKSDGTFETFTATVENGKVTITVNEFSPFMIALTDDDVATSNNPQTSSINVVSYSVLALFSLVGIITIIVRRKKEA